MMKSLCKRFRYCITFLPVLLFGLFVLPVNTTAQETGTNPGSKRIAIKSAYGTASIIPVTTSEDNVSGDILTVNKSICKSNSSTEWNLIASTGGIAHAISFATSTIGYIAKEGGLVDKTTDGGYTWTTVLNTGFPNYWYGVHALSADKVIISGFNTSTNNGMLRWTTNGGATWSNDSILVPGNWVTNVEFADPLHGVIAGFGSGIVYITTDGGTEWWPRLADPTGGWFAGNFTLRPDGKYYITGIKFCRSTNFGINWTYRGSIDEVFDGGVSFPDTLHGWTGGGSISPTVQGWVHRTSDGGATWTDRILELPYPVRGVFFLDSLNGVAQGGNYSIGGIWETNDGGLTWREGVNTNSEMQDLDWQRVSPDSIDIWSVGFSTAGGNYHTPVYKKRMYYVSVPVELTSFTANVKDNKVILDWITATETNNRGFEIERASSELVWEKIGYVQGYGTTTEVKKYTFVDDEVNTGTHTYRLKQIDLDGTFEYSSEISVEVTVPDEFNLSQNYPNPFNPSTVIEFGIPKSSFVSLKIYDVLGNEIQTLVNEEKPAGRYEVKFNGSSFSSGIYYYTLKSGDFSSTKKLILMK